MPSSYQALVWLGIVLRGLGFGMAWFGMDWYTCKAKLSSFTTNPGWVKSKLRLNPAWAELGNILL